MNTKPMPVYLTKAGMELVSHSANFRHAAQLYDLGPGEKAGRRVIGTSDGKDAVITELNEAYVCRTLTHQGPFQVCAVADGAILPLSELIADEGRAVLGADTLSAMMADKAAEFYVNGKLLASNKWQSLCLADKDGIVFKPTMEVTQPGSRTDTMQAVYSFDRAGNPLAVTPETQDGAKAADMYQFLKYGISERVYFSIQYGEHPLERTMITRDDLRVQTTDGAAIDVADNPKWAAETQELALTDADLSNLTPDMGQTL